MIVREYIKQDLPEIIRIWNEFPDTDETIIFEFK